MPNDRIAMIGDVHGDVELLIHLMRALDALGARTLVFLGDLVGRTAGSSAVLDLIATRRAAAGERTVVLCGNHERALRRFLESGNFLAYALAGGLPVVKSYLGSVACGDIRDQLANMMPDSHLTIVYDCQPYYEDDELICSHMGIDPYNPGDRSWEAMTATPHVDQFEGHVPVSKLVVCGHYGVGDEPVIIGNFVCLDTGAGGGGPLTALLFPSRRIAQAIRGKAGGISIRVSEGRGE